MSSLEESIKRHQKLVDLIAEYTDQDGICHLSTPEMAKILGVSQTRVMQFIKQINTEETCICRENGGYSLRFHDISKQGTFAKILLLVSNKNLMNCNEKELAASYGVQRRTVQAAKAYLKM